MNGTFTPLCAQIIPPTRPLILHASLLNFKHILFLPFLPLSLPLFIFYVFLPSSLSPSSFLSTCLFLVSVISSSSPLCRMVGHILASTHLHIKHIVRKRVLVCEWKRGTLCVCACKRESVVALNFHFNQHVSERTILLPQGRTEGPLHNLSLSLCLFPLALVQSLHPSLSVTTN